MIYVGIDWSEKHHDVEVLSEDGRRLGKLRIGHGVEGLAKLQGVLQELAEEPAQVAVALESAHGLLVSALVEFGYAVYPINPKVSVRYRDRHSVAGAKSDSGDAHVLANLVRTDRHLHRQLAPDSPLAQEIRARARAHQRSVEAVVRLYNQLRSLLNEFYPAGAALLQEEVRDALAVLSLAPSPSLARGLSEAAIEAALREHGRQRNRATRAAKIHALLQAPQLELKTSQLVEAYSDEVASLVRRLLQARTEEQLLEEQMSLAFEKHPDAGIFLSFPGVGETIGARALGEMGDSPTRYPDARSLRNYAGNAPVTRASGKKRDVVRRIARNRRSADTFFRMAETAVLVSPGAKAFYDRQIQAGKPHNTAIRAVANKLIGPLHACLKNHCLYDEGLAWPQAAVARAA